LIVLWVLWFTSLTIGIISIIGYIALAVMSRYNNRAMNLYRRFEMDIPFAILIIWIIVWAINKIISNVGLV